MEKNDPTRKQNVHLMFETTLAAIEMNSGEEESEENLREHVNESEFGINTNNTRNVRYKEGDDEEIMKDEKRGVQKCDIKMTRVRKENDERDVRNGRNSESQILSGVNNGNERGNVKWKDMTKRDVLVKGERKQKATASTQFGKPCKGTLNGDDASRQPEEQKSTESVDVHVGYTEMNIDHDIP